MRFATRRTKFDKYPNRCYITIMNSNTNIKQHPIEIRYAHVIPGSPDNPHGYVLSMHKTYRAAERAMNLYHENLANTVLEKNVLTRIVELPYFVPSRAI